MFTKYLATAMLGTALVSGAALAQSTAPTSSASERASASAVNAAADLKGTWRGSKLVGLSVYNESNEKLGDVNEVLVDNSGKINAVIVGIGGFLGVGEHNIAVSFDKLKWVNEPIRAASTDRTPVAPGMSPSSTTTTGSASGTATQAARDNWYPDHAVMSGTKEQLKAIPAFKYSDYNK